MANRVMKDSGIDWIEKIPQDWKITKVKYIFITGKGLSITKKDLKDDGCPVVNYGEIHSKTNRSIGINNSLIKFISPNFIKYNKQCLAKRNDFIFADTSEDYDGVGNFIYVDTDNIFSGYHTIKLTPKKQNIEYKYLGYLFLSNCWRKQLRMSVNGIKVFSITQQILKNAEIILPLFHEQKEIATYLDNKCNEIDKLKEDITKQIDILKEYKQSIITETVTKGLNPNVPMKDSGIDWIGKIPQNWKVTKVKYIFITGKGLSITKKDLKDDGCPVVNYGEIHSKTNRSIGINNSLIKFISPNFIKYNKQCLVKRNDFIFADTSEDYDGVGNFVYIDIDNIFSGYHTIKLTPKKQNIEYKYLGYLFLSNCWRKQLRMSVNGIKVFSITQQILKNAEIILPSFHE